MQIVIKIHERDYQAIVQSGHVPYGVVDAIMRGKILPKGQRLIDEDALRELKNYRIFKEVLYSKCDEWCKFPEYRERGTMCGACDIGGIKDLLENALEEVTLMNEQMTFPDSIYEFLSDYSFKDEEEVYTNGSLLIPTFRVKQALEHYFEEVKADG